MKPRLHYFKLALRHLKRRGHKVISIEGERMEIWLPTTKVVSSLSVLDLANDERKYQRDQIKYLRAMKRGRL